MRVESMMYPPPHLSYSEQDPDDGDLLDEDGQGEHNSHFHHGIDSNKAEIRKSNKPIMEKRRRARINNCLNDLKGILLEAMRKDPARHSKLEKADILELTVRHLQNVQRNQLAVAMATDPTVLHRFKNGFSECATEVSRYMVRLDGTDPGIRSRLTNHLGACVNGLQQVGPMGLAGPQRFVPPFGPPSPGPMSIPGVKPLLLPGLLSPQSGIPIVQIQPAPGPGIVDVQIQHVPGLGDVNNNHHTHLGRFAPIQTPSATITSSKDGLRPPRQSAFTTVARRPPTPPPSPSLSSLSSDTPNVSMCSGSDSSSLSLGSEKGLNNASGSPSFFPGSSPIDFSLKLKDRGVVRVLKVEPMNKSMNSLDCSGVSGKESMWRPW